MRLRYGWLLLLAAVPGSAWAQDAADAVDAVDTGDAVQAAPPALVTAVTGYLDTRLVATALASPALFDTADVPRLSNLTEANVQLKLRWDEAGFVLADASFFYQRAGMFATTDPTGRRVEVAAHDVPSYRPLALINELYGAYNVSEHANVTLGKKRIVWGPGMALNPTDLLNPPKDPTDPTFQRAGAWLARLELPFETFTVSLVGAAKVLRQYGGVPAALGTYPSYPSHETVLDATNFKDDRDTASHYSLVGRVYSLWHDTDINLLYAFTNLYNDAFRAKSRVGASLSRLVWRTLELHGEALMQRGSARLYVPDACLAGGVEAVACAARGEAALHDRLQAATLTPKLLLGGSFTFADDAMLTLEYTFNGEGYTDHEFQNYMRAAFMARQAGVGLPQRAATSDPGAPQKFSFEPLRRHYVFLTYMKPHILDDFTASLVVLLNAHDTSGLVAPSLTWSAREWLNLSLYAFVTVNGLASQRLDVGGEKISEFGASPSAWRILASARVFY